MRREKVGEWEQNQKNQTILGKHCVEIYARIGSERDSSGDDDVGGVKNFVQKHHQNVLLKQRSVHARILTHSH